MKPTRAQRLARWLRELAEGEDDTVAVLEKLGPEVADPAEARTRARLFREIANYLEATPLPVLPAVPVPPASLQVVGEPPKPPRKKL
jgi:hypothetical protein